MDAKYVLVLIDGVRVNDPSNPGGYAALERLSLADVKQIEIIKGAQSGVWGADAAGGVINIVTRGTRRGFHADGELMGGSYTTQKGALSLSYATDRYDLKAGFDGTKSDGFPPTVTSDFDARDIERTYYAQAGVNLGESTRVEGNYRKITSDTQYQAFDYATFTPYKAHTTADEDFYTARLMHSWEAFDVTLYGNGSDFTRKYYETTPSKYVGHEYEGGLKGAWHYAQGQVDVGYVYRESKMDEIAGATVNESMKDNGLYASLVHRMLQEKMVVNLAFRFDNYDAYDDKATGKVGFKYFLPWGEGAYVGANVGNGYRVPTLFERFGYQGWFVAGNPDLQPEDVTSYDATLALYGVSATYFYNDITNLITGLYDPTTFQTRYVNVDGTSTVQGVDLRYRKAFEAIRTTLDLGYTYTDAKDAQKRRLLKRPRHSATAGVTFRPTETFSANVNAEYAADYLDVDFNTYATKQMGEYIVWNAVFNYGLADKGGVYLKLNNIFDEKYQLADGYNTEGQSVYVGWRFHY